MWSLFYYSSLDPSSAQSGVYWSSKVVGDEVAVKGITCHHNEDHEKAYAGHMPLGPSTFGSMIVHNIGEYLIDS
ncbi:hypothetical protein PanWU01x14_097740 [Parasponia andersonii]|uniref:Uncharacterized protein n=1 Tax=Parasponia andersonii TaxID=3476 RepID=A0A2P5D4I4_PARAD|nr:hypothetical protein PanWU01x14_097740 [Parasponia andersonii]